MERAEAVEFHLDVCPECTRVWKELRGTVRMVAHLGRQRCPVDLRGPVMQSVARIPARSGASWLLRRTVIALAAGSVVLASLLLPTLWPHAARFTADPRRSLAPNDSLDVPVHIQYNMANSLGTADGLLLSLPSEAESAPHGPQNPVLR